MAFDASACAVVKMMVRRFAVLPTPTVRTASGSDRQRLMRSQAAHRHHGSDTAGSGRCRTISAADTSSSRGPPPAAAPTGEGADHDTIKPVDPMRWLCRLVTCGRIVVDPFAGSGTTASRSRKRVCSELDPARDRILRRHRATLRRTGARARTGGLRWRSSSLRSPARPTCPRPDRCSFSITPRRVAWRTRSPPVHGAAPGRRQRSRHPSGSPTPAR